MAAQLPNLRSLGFGVRLGVSLIVIVILGGYAVSGIFLKWEYENRDELPQLTTDDIRGAYHGVTRIAPMRTALERNHPPELPAEERTILLEWLGSTRIVEDYDNLDLGDFAPSEIIAANCLSCHARDATLGEGIGQTMPLEYWDDIKVLSFSREVSPKPINIVAASTHAHAPSMALILLAIGALALLSRWGRGLVGAIMTIGAASLLADMAGQWLARWSEPMVWAIIGGGAVYVVAVALLGLLVIAECWLPQRRAAE